MTSISGTSSSTILKGMSGNRLTGLASGLDTDALIEAMTTTTRSRIAKVQQQKQLTSWKMDAFRSISSKLISFQKKYTSLSSSTALRSSSFFSKSVITPSGENSKYVKVSGNGNNAGNVSIAGVEQLAQNAKYVKTVGSSDGILKGQFTEVQVSKLAGQTMTFEYLGQPHTLKMSEKEYTSVDDVVTELNAQMVNIDIGGGSRLSEVMKVTADGGKLQFAFNAGIDAMYKEPAKVTAIDGNMKTILGIEENDILTADTTGAILDDDKVSVKKPQSMKELLGGKELTFTYNGKAATITLPAADDAQWQDANGDFDENKLEGILEKELGKAFGSGRIDVAIQEVNKDGKMVKEINFQTKLPNGGGVDTTSTLSVSGDYNALQAMGMKAGASNRLDLKAGIKSVFGTQADYSVTIVDKASKQVYTINKTVDNKEFTADTSIQDVIKAINASDAGVKVSYLETSNQLSIASTHEGASGNFAIMGTVKNEGKVSENYNDYFNVDGTVKNAGSENLGQSIFGTGVYGSGYDVEGYTEGKDAIVWVDYGTGKPTAINRSSNTFDVEGMKVTVSKEFGVSKQAGTAVFDGEPVTFEASVDVEKVTKVVKEMIDEYNEIIKLANDKVKEKKNRDYTPLSDEQKEDMKEEEIEKWETKAKEGILFNNSELRSFTSEIRFLFSGSGLGNSLAKMGITTSDDYADAGKIVFDEEKFKAALEEDSEAVSKVFAGYVDEDGKLVNGLMDNVKTVFDKYGAAEGGTKGIFVQIAGTPESALSMLTNTMQKQLDEYEDTIKTLQSKLEDEAERYYQKFSSLEVYINNMNAQSGWLSQQFGGY